MQLSHIIPNDVLSNGVTYIATVKVYDKLDNGSPDSNNVLFTCYTTPLFYINNLSDGDIVNDATIPISLYYSQAENVELNQYTVTLYDYGHNEIFTSGAVYENTALSR